MGFKYEVTSIMNFFFLIYSINSILHLKII